MSMRVILGIAVLAGMLTPGCGGGKYDFRGRSFEELVVLTRSTHPAVRVGAVQALADIVPEDPRAAALLGEIVVQGEDRDMVHTAVHALSRFPAPRLAAVVPTLAAGLEGATPFVQERILEACQGLGAEAQPLVPAVGRMLEPPVAGRDPESGLPAARLVDFLAGVRRQSPAAEALLRHVADDAHDAELARRAREALED